MLIWIKSLFFWNEIFKAGVYSYQENAITGKRRVRRFYPSGYSPLDMDWLNYQPKKPLVPPTGGSAVKK